MSDENPFEDVTPEDVKMSHANPVTGAWHDPDHPLNEEPLTNEEQMLLGDALRKEGRKFESLSDEELVQQVASIREKEDRSNDELLLIGEYAIRVLKHTDE